MKWTEDNTPKVCIETIPGNHPELPNQLEGCLSRAECALDLFIKKNLGYGDTSFMFGEKGQVQDLYRKTMKLKRQLWDGIEDAAGEPPEEIVNDIVGHCLLTLQFLYERA